jgi:aminoglycoside 6-adenylyltransferase
VGGASTRFGSPKALASFRGKTLAERGFRLLEEVCDEVLAVGKTADGLGLPFPVLDDASEERAPVFGLIAGLRAAANEVCVALPVDCPLVRADTLRALASTIAVTQTGPLPGGYSKAQLPELEARVARGELSLRGVNGHVLEVPEGELANVNTRMDLLAAAVADWAREREDIRALLVVGSQARDGLPADRWSDLDVILLVRDPKRYLDDAGWVEEFGQPMLTFVEATKGGDRERRVLYESGEDVDFVVLPDTIAELFGDDAEASELLGRGYRLLVDRMGLGEKLELHGDRVPQPVPAQGDFSQLTADFWYHAVWAAKKLRRGEVFVALECLDAYMKARLVRLLEWHARSLDPELDAWHGGRFLERWADPGALAALEQAYARYDLRDVARALWETVDLWQGVEEETARRLGLETTVDHADLRRRIAEVVPDPRPGRTAL